MQWIVDNRVVTQHRVRHRARRLRATTGTRSWPNGHNADAAFALLENPMTTGLPDGMPYGIAVGNHDQSPIGTARTGRGRERHDDPLQPDVRQSLRPSRRRSYFGDNYTFGRSSQQHGQPLRAVQRRRDGLHHLPPRVRSVEQRDTPGRAGLDGRHPRQRLPQPSGDRHGALSARSPTDRSRIRAKPSTTRSRTTRTHS